MTLIPLALLASVLSLPQVRFPSKPAERDFINDEAKLIKPAEAAEIKSVCDRVFTEKSIPIAVVTIHSLRDYGAGSLSVERYATALFAHWGIGRADWNYGMLFLVSNGDRKARIELGASWGHLKDAAVQQLLNTEIVPRFKRGDPGGGILAGVRGLREIATAVPGGDPSSRVHDVAPPVPFHDAAPHSWVRPHSSTGLPDGLGGIFITAVVVIVGLSLLSMLLRGLGGGSTSWGSGGFGSSFGGGCLGAILGSMLSGGFRHRSRWNNWSSGGGGGWGGSGGFGGGRSGGGGFSGGGGATGSW